LRIGIAVDDFDRDRLVISLQRDHPIRLSRLQLYERLDDAAAVRTAIDIIAEKDESRGPPVGVPPTQRHQLAQLLQRAVNVADSVSEWRLTDIGCGRRREMMAVFRHDRSVRIHENMGTFTAGSA
jgi:hypothetical protein